MSPRLQKLFDALVKEGFSPTERLNEITVEVKAADYKAAALKLRDHPELKFEELIDLCGMDYQTYGSDAGDPSRAGRRFASVVHLLSITHNWRLRLRAYCAADEFPLVDTLTEVWPAASWFEREAFDLYGIVFDGHPDLRRILTDYGFVGHPFRKDFPISGYVEMRYDPEQKRVIYQPVSIEPREVTPRIVREEHYAEGRG
jgi:NADH-quinone oxidoreductase subunit C